MNLADALIMAGVTDSFVAPTTIGQAYGGGYYGGKINIDGTIYALIVAPKVGGEGQFVYRTSGLPFTGNTSTYDGWLIRNNMIAEGIEDFPAQAACMSLTIGGYNDWYIGSKYEMEILYRNLKPTSTTNVTSSGANPYAVPTPTTNYNGGVPARTSVLAFRSTGTEFFVSDYYFTATQGPSGPDYVHGKRFTTGADGEDFNGYDYPIRAIRRVALPS